MEALAAKMWGDGGHPACTSPSPPQSELAGLGGLCFPAGFLEKNRDVLNRDILALVHSSQNKFLREIFGLESKESRRGPGSLIRVKAGSQQFKVGSGGPALPRAWGADRPGEAPLPGVWVRDSQLGCRGSEKGVRCCGSGGQEQEHRTLPASQ